MKTSRFKASSKKQARRLAAANHRKRLLRLAKERGPLIPNAVLRALAGMHLPRDADVYNARLRELLAILSPRNEPRGDRSGGRAVCRRAAAGFLSASAK